MDTLFVQGLRVDAVIGVLDWEQRITQPLRFDLQLALDLREATGEDSAAGLSVDYGAVARAVAELVGGRSWQLVETVAEAVAQHLLEAFPIQSVQLRLTKAVHVAGAGNFDAGVEIVRPTSEAD